MKIADVILGLLPNSTKPMAGAPFDYPRWVTGNASHNLLGVGFPSAGRRLRGARQRGAFIARGQKVPYFRVAPASDVTYPVGVWFLSRMFRVMAAGH